jgi:hypothetical protein
MDRKSDQLTPDEGRAQVGKARQRPQLVPLDCPDQEPPPAELHGRATRPQVNFHVNRCSQSGTADRDLPGSRIDPHARA